MKPLTLNQAPAFDFSPVSTKIYRLFDLSFVTNYSFKTILPETDGEADLIFVCHLMPPIKINWEDCQPHYVSQTNNKAGQPHFIFYSASDCIILRFGGIADFYLWSDRIDCHLIEPKHEITVEILFLGTVMACWFELQGIVALHAAASVIGGEAVAFLSNNKGGKTSLAAALLQQGYPLLTDDILLVEVEDGRITGRSGYPQMRMWPEQATLIFGDNQDFPAVHPNLDKRRIPLDFETPGNFQFGRFPLARCYLPERFSAESGQTQVEISPVSPVESVLTLAGYSFLFWLVERIGLQPGRLGLFAQMASTVPVSHLRYPSGVEHLATVCQAVVSDLHP